LFFFWLERKVSISIISFLVRLPPRWVLGRSAHRAHLRGTHSLGSFATQPSPSTSSDNPSKPICLTVFNCGYFTVTCSLGIVTARAFVTVSSVFEMTVYLLTYFSVSEPIDS